MKYCADPEILRLDDLAEIAWLAIEPIWDDLPLRSHRRLAEFMADLTEGQRGLIALDWCQKEIRNGGFEQLLSNPTGNLVPYAIAGLRLIGAERYAAILDEVAAMFGSEYPRTGSARARSLRRLLRDQTQCMRDLEEEFLGLLADPEQDLERYRGRFVLERPEEFVRHGGAA